MATDRLTATRQFSCLPELSAILVRHADRVFALLGEGRVINDPGHDGRGLLHRLQHAAPHGGEQGVVVPRRVGDQMMQRLVRTANVVRGEACRHRLHAICARWAVGDRGNKLSRARCGRHVSRHAPGCRDKPRNVVAVCLTPTPTPCSAHFYASMFYNTVVLAARGRSTIRHFGDCHPFSRPRRISSLHWHPSAKKG